MPPSWSRSKYDILPAVTEIDDALKPDAPQIWQGAPGNQVGFNRFGDHAKAEARIPGGSACRDARRRAPAPDRERDGAARGDGRMGRRPHDRAYRQPEPAGTRDTLCGAILGMPADKVRVLVRDIGGGFGMKTGIQPDESVAVWVAKVLKRPVKWRAERSEEFWPRRPPAATSCTRCRWRSTRTAGSSRCACGLCQCRRLSVGRRHRHPAVRRPRVSTGPTTSR